MLEQMQRSSTKFIPGLRDLRYEERLNKGGLCHELLGEIIRT